METVLFFIIAMTVTAALIRPLSRFAIRWQVLDMPEPRKVHEQPMPRIGGIAIVAGVIIAIVSVALIAPFMPDIEEVVAQIELTRTTLAAGVSVSILFVAGLWDDRFGLGYKGKFAAQVIAIVLIMILGDLSIDTISLSERIAIPPYLGIPLTFFFLLGITNAVNLADGLDGLAGGLAVLSLSALVVLAIAVDDIQVAMLAFAVAGAVVGFLRFNTYPARVFMGDAGSQPLGFIIACLSIRLTQNPETPLSAGLPLLIIGVPIIDTLMVLALRLRDRRNPFVADRNHLHHRLLKIGLDHHEAVFAIYVSQIVFIVLAWLMRFESDMRIVPVFAIIAAAILLLLIMAKDGRLASARSNLAAGGSHRLGEIVRRLAQPEHVPRWVRWLIPAILLIYSFGAASLSARATEVETILAPGVAGVLLILVFWRRGRGSAGALERALLFVSAATVVYLDYSNSQTVLWFVTLQWFLLPLLAVSIAVRFRLSGVQRYGVSSLDLLVLFLVLFISLVIPNLPGIAVPHSNLAIALAKLGCLFYALETVLWEDRGSWVWAPSLCAAVLMGFVAFTGQLT